MYFSIYSNLQNIYSKCIIWEELRVDMHQWNQDQTRPWKLIIPIQKDNQSQKSDYHISEHESENISLSQLKLQKDEDDKKLEKSDDSSELISCHSDIHGEGDDSHYEAEYDEGLVKAKELRDISDLNEKETRDLIKSFYEANFSEVDVLH